MNNEMIIAQMKEICRSGEPEDKGEFFRELRIQGLLHRRPVVMNHGEFLARQLCYIEKWVWVLSGMLMLFIVWVCSRNTGNYPFALTPLLAVGILAETGRSYRWKMAELEHAARFSLRSIVLARMFLVGLIDTAGLLIVTFAVRSYLTYSLIRVFLYMMVPYLLAAFLGSLYERKKRTDAGLGSIVICLLSSAVFAAAPIFMSSLYEESLTIIWAAAFILLICCLAVSVREQMREMEEPVWN